jgi:hypothetical protein
MRPPSINGASPKASAIFEIDATRSFISGVSGRAQVLPFVSNSAQPAAPA